MNMTPLNTSVINEKWHYRLVSEGIYPSDILAKLAEACYQQSLNIKLLNVNQNFKDCTNILELICHSTRSSEAENEAVATIKTVLAKAKKHQILKEESQ